VSALPWLTSTHKKIRWITPSGFLVKTDLNYFRPAAARSSAALSVRWLRPGLAALHIASDVSLRRRTDKLAALGALQARSSAQHFWLSAVFGFGRAWRPFTSQAM